MVKYGLWNKEVFVQESAESAEYSEEYAEYSEQISDETDV